MGRGIDRPDSYVAMVCPHPWNMVIVPTQKMGILGIHECIDFLVDLMTTNTGVSATFFVSTKDVAGSRQQ
jgi:hypothetical protein